MPPRKIKKNWRKYEVPKKFSTLIVSNKRSSRVNEAYSDRLKCIQWFEKHHPEKVRPIWFRLGPVPLAR